MYEWATRSPPPARTKFFHNCVGLLALAAPWLKFTDEAMMPRTLAIVPRRNQTWKKLALSMHDRDDHDTDNHRNTHTSTTTLVWFATPSHTHTWTIAGVCVRHVYVPIV